jgi:hypothetical protein
VEGEFDLPGRRVVLAPISTLSCPDQRRPSSLQSTCLHPSKNWCGTKKRCDDSVLVCDVGATNVSTVRVAFPTAVARNKTDTRGRRYTPSSPSSTLTAGPPALAAPPPNAGKLACAFSISTSRT